MEGRSNPHVVVLFPGALGDLILALPALTALRACNPAALVTVAVSGWLLALAATSRVADEIVSLDDADASGLFGGTRLPTWFGERPDVYAWMGARDPDVRARLTALAGEARFFRVVRDDGPGHAGAEYARQLGLGDVGGAFRWPSVVPSARTEAMLAAVRRPVLAVHAGAGSPAKRWATAGFRDVADRWRARGGDVIEIVGPADLALPPVSDRRAIEWGLEELAGLLGRVDGYVGNDSGVTHLAAAAGARGVAVFGPTSAHRWAPATDAIGALQAVDSSHGGIAVTSLDPSLVWRALDARCCLDKLRGGT